ncbi:hypothetical protein LMG22931_06699 [Paraburkholderia nemoris]|nr:hypothetical protein LMG22931_06699 [Paraburkholderia nemoris]
MLYFTPNPAGYTAAKFSEDVAAMLPFALPEYRKYGRMISCAHCGIAHRGTSFAILAPAKPDMIAEVEIASVCDVCAPHPALLPPGQWAHVDAASALFVAAEDRATFVTDLRWFGALALREKFGWPLVSKLLHADGSVRDTCNAMIFFDGGSNGTQEEPFMFPWESEAVSFAGGEGLKAVLEAALRYGNVMNFGALFADSPKPEEAT